MTRVKGGENTHRRHRKAVKAAKGYRGLRSTNFRAAKNALAKAGMHAYAHRRTRKRDFRSLWILRINAACRELGIKYSRLIFQMEVAGVRLNRKMMAELAANEPEVFKAVIEAVK